MLQLSLVPLVQARADLRDWCFELGFQTRWRLIHYLTDLKTWILCLLPVLLLQRLAPARPPAKGNWASFAHDWSYPLMTIGIASHLITPVVQMIHDAGVSLWPEGPGQWVKTWSTPLQFMLAFVIQDFLRYTSHFLRHKISWLWHFHAVHHSQEHLNPGTTHRAHPFEALVGAALMTLPIGLIGIDPVPWIYAGVTSVFWDLFIHSNTRTNLGWAGKFIVSPQNHLIHHSALEHHFDCNYGERLVLWDWLFRTLHRDRISYPPTGCRESALLMERVDGVLWIPRSWGRQTVHPFKQIAADWRSRSVGSAI